MKFEHMNTQEIIRIATPETDLERALFKIIDDDDLDSAHYKALCEELEDDIENYCCSACEEKEDELADINDENDKLKKLLDDNEIDYSEIA